MLVHIILLHRPKVRSCLFHIDRHIVPAIFVENDYNLSISTYVEVENTYVDVDIVKLNAEIDEIVKREEIEALHKAIAQLDQREKTIILMRYGIGNGKEATLDTVALNVGLTKERVRQIQKIAEAKIQRILMGVD